MASDGDIRVLLVLDLLLSLTFAAVALYALDLANISTFTPRNLAIATLLLAALTYVAVLRE